MKTKFDIKEDVFIRGHIKSIAVSEKGEIGYKVEFKNFEGVHVLIFDEDDIVEDSSKHDKIATTTPETPELRTCGNCKYEFESLSDRLSPCYMCCKNPQDNRSEYWIEGNN